MLKTVDFDVDLYPFVSICVDLLCMYLLTDMSNGPMSCYEYTKLINVIVNNNIREG